MKECSFNNSVLKIILGDITKEKVDAIVNAANSRLLGGGGVDGAIHRTGGPEIMAECDKIREAKGGCPTGEAVITTAGALQAKYVIHTVGPVWNGGKRKEPELLASCYFNCLRIANELNCRSIAFPSISTGAYRFPTDKAAYIALTAIAAEIKKSSLVEVRFILFSMKDFDLYSETLDKITYSQRDD
jgi:O-acetyl-ADP-ribose deacetylase (regulator of RNase III)